MNVMWTNTAFEMYMGQHDEVTAAAFEPARLRAEQLGRLADAQGAVDASERTIGRHGFATAVRHALVGGRRLARG